MANVGTPESVSGTNDDATFSKLSASKLGYFEDEFVQYFASPKAQRMPPIINRGYYTRVASFRTLIDQFLNSGDKQKQIVSFGAGFDTNFWRLKHQKRNKADPNQRAPVKYFEIDYPQVVKHKTKLIQQSLTLSSLIDELVVTGDGGISSPSYALLSADLHNQQQVESGLFQHGISRDLPTLFLSECVLIYVDVSSSEKLIGWTTEFFSQGMFLLYEQIKPFDAFGEVMLRNLQARGVPLTSIKKYPDLPSQKNRFLKLGYTHVDAKDMNDMMRCLLGPDESKRVNRIEMLDEYEEWTLIQGHYCVVVATFDKGNTVMNTEGVQGRGIWETITLTKFNS